MPILRSGTQWGTDSEMAEQNQIPNPVPTPALSLPPIPKYSGNENEEPERFFALLDQVACMQSYNEEKMKEILPIFLTDTALDYVLQLKHANQYAAKSYAEIKKDLTKLACPTLPIYKAEAEIYKIRQEPAEHVDLYFIRKLRAIRKFQPTADVTKQIYYIIMGLKEDLLRKVANKKFNTLQELQ